MSHSFIHSSIPPGPSEADPGLSDGWMDGWMDGRTDGRTDGQTEERTGQTDSPCILQDFVPFGSLRAAALLT